MTQRTCLQCGQSIAHKRSDAKYCSDRCRMRYRRSEKTRQLVTELTQLCSEIPNHTEQRSGIYTAIVIRNVASGNYQKIGVPQLLKTPEEDLKRMIKWKKGEVWAYKLTQ
ncbi:MAG TPA: hypothetical protein VJ964_17615 [Balneolaceae bacterium]|nr:hypothetical protein [Balneolaceae bacterium]